MANKNTDLSDWRYLQSRTTFLSRDEILEMAVRLSFRIPGHIVEFGGCHRAFRTDHSACGLKV